MYGRLWANYLVAAIMDADMIILGDFSICFSLRNHYAFSISIPYYRLTDQLKEDMIAAVTKTKTIIEFQLDSYTD